MSSGSSPGRCSPTSCSSTKSTGRRRGQSALLEPMEERNATVEGITHPLPRPYLLVATENPVEQHGTYPLPEGQLDRFTMTVDVGYPDREREGIVRRQLLRHPIEDVEPIVSAEEIARHQDAVRAVHVDGTVIDYVAALVEATRLHPDVALGASPRAMLALVRVPGEGRRRGARLRAARRREGAGARGPRAPPDSEGPRARDRRGARRDSPSARGGPRSAGRRRARVARAPADEAVRRAPRRRGVAVRHRHEHPVRMAAGAVVVAARLARGWLPPSTSNRSPRRGRAQRAAPAHQGTASAWSSTSRTAIGARSFAPRRGRPLLGHPRDDPLASKRRGRSPVHDPRRAAARRWPSPRSCASPPALLRGRRRPTLDRRRRPHRRVSGGDSLGWIPRLLGRAIGGSLHPRRPRRGSERVSRDPRVPNGRQHAARPLAVDRETRLGHGSRVRAGAGTEPDRRRRHAGRRRSGRQRRADAPWTSAARSRRPRASPPCGRVGRYGSWRRAGASSMSWTRRIPARSWVARRHRSGRRASAGIGPRAHGP